MRATWALPTRAATLAALCATFLAAPSSGFATTQVARPNNSPASARSGGGGAFSSRGDFYLQQKSSKERMYRAVTTLRGGSPTMKIPGRDAAAAAIAAISVPAVALSGGPALFAQGLLLSLLMSIDGFRIREHFVSYGYGLSVASQAAGAAWLFRDGLHTLSALHAAGLVAYGLRLVFFCRWRDSLPCFQNRARSVLKPSPKRQQAIFWVICGSLYAFLALPSVYALRRLPVAEGLVGVSQAGLATMAAGLLIEAVADWQKSRFKKRAPDGFCNSGLFRLSRHPNYFGELVFWGGVWLAATPSFTKWYHWTLSAVGPFQILSIILRATKGLEKRQAEKYGSSEGWKEYSASTPILVPGSRQYTLAKGDGNK